MFLSEFSYSCIGRFGDLRKVFLIARLTYSGILQNMIRILLFLFVRPSRKVHQTLCICFPGKMTTHAESINADIQRGLDRRLRHITTLNTEQNKLSIKVTGDN